MSQPNLLGLPDCRNQTLKIHCQAYQIAYEFIPIRRNYIRFLAPSHIFTDILMSVIQHNLHDRWWCLDQHFVNFRPSTAVGKNHLQTFTRCSRSAIFRHSLHDIILRRSFPGCSGVSLHISCREYSGQSYRSSNIWAT